MLARLGGSTLACTGRETLRRITVHGDDFIVGGSSANSPLMKNGFERRFPVKVHTLGFEIGQEREVRILSRVIRWTPTGFEYEPDQRHSEIAVRELGFESARAVVTQGTKHELALTGIPEAASKSFLV